jgi:hypothetical protein
LNASRNVFIIYAFLCFSSFLRQNIPVASDTWESGNSLRKLVWQDKSESDVRYCPIANSNTRIAQWKYTSCLIGCPHTTSARYSNKFQYTLFICVPYFPNHFLIIYKSRICRVWCLFHYSALFRRIYIILCYACVLYPIFILILACIVVIVTFLWSAIGMICMHIHFRPCNVILLYVTAFAAGTNSQTPSSHILIHRNCHILPYLYFANIPLNWSTHICPSSYIHDFILQEHSLRSITRHLPACTCICFFKNSEKNEKKELSFWITRTKFISFHFFQLTSNLINLKLKF